MMSVGRRRLAARATGVRPPPSVPSVVVVSAGRCWLSLPAIVVARGYRGVLIPCLRQGSCIELAAFTSTLCTGLPMVVLPNIC
ncbi:hypothetical protein BS78_05G224400 [Paspalum vaginatum]|nr:hypothetical protein BS78_05G224400 [Paspalum vaginatum]